MGWSPAQVGALENCGIKVEDATGDIKWREFETVDIIKPEPIKSPKSNIQYEATRLPDYNKVGNIIAVTVAWRGGTYMVKMFFPTVKKPSRKEVQDQVRKVYPGSKLVTYQVSEYDSGEPIIQTR
jgi:acetoacetate decarboxylase